MKNRQCIPLLKAVFCTLAIHFFTSLGWAESGQHKVVAEKSAEPPAVALRAQLKQKFVGRVPDVAMVSIPAGSFVLGGDGGEDQISARPVQIGAFELGRTEVTFDQWDACVGNGGCDHYPRDEGWGRGSRPVINVSWIDVQQFIVWLNKSTRKQFRLPSEAEWEYAARAGRAGNFYTGKCLPTSHANYDGNNPGAGCPKADYQAQTLPVGSLDANAFGLHDMHGNVWEWTQDCWNPSHAGGPEDGRARETGHCYQRVSRGGAWYGPAEVARLTYRVAEGDAGYRGFGQGFRLAKSR